MSKHTKFYSLSVPPLSLAGEMKFMKNWAWGGGKILKKSVYEIKRGKVEEM